jgi:hypothetical protein
VDALVITWRELLVVVILVLAVYVAEMLLFIRSGGQRPRLWRRDAQPAGASGREVRVLREELAELRNEMAELRGEMEVLKSMQAAGNSPYSQAIEMAKEGHDVGEVAAACGISRGEAELIVAVHRADAP